jgi:hypothetical protein
MVKSKPMKINRAFSQNRSFGKASDKEKDI